jgi:hypothetical protein
MSRVYLNLGGAWKEKRVRQDITARGCKFDSKVKRWYIPPEVQDAELYLYKWLPETHKLKLNVGANSIHIATQDERVQFRELEDVEYCSLCKTTPNRIKCTCCPMTGWLRRPCPELPIARRVQEFESVRSKLMNDPDNFEVDTKRSAFMAHAVQCICTTQIRNVFRLRCKSTGDCIFIGMECASRLNASLKGDCQLAQIPKCVRCNMSVEDLRGKKAKAPGGAMCKDCWKWTCERTCECGRTKKVEFTRCYTCGGNKSQK